ncbi:hypothetical protein E3O19_11630 [Cryobacterium algoritolerans]|uniref:Uncharacterized protein n=1 Tax=Cryobacterium algoritolerans TaxID=1259184 RepID=A0A4R8WUS6_9MICO|nr:tripartite tricarboxylate transporter TctB family protein [Cryobacterium algoritolerans]TFC13982.1 hypothetical protein E3O19_11630 [Cryobacterium algoritolerans]
MSDTTPNDGNTNPDTDASATTPGRHETGPVGLDAETARREADARDGAAPAASAHPAEPVGEPISYDAPDAATQAYAPAPVSADSVKRDTYVPAATVGTGAATLASDDSPTREQPAPHTQQGEPVRTDAPATTAAPVNTTVQPPLYIQAPTPPKYKGNRGVGILIVLLGTAVFAALYALVALALSGIGSGSLNDTTAKFTDFIVLPIFYVPVIFFFLAFVLLVAIVNRGGWWAYVLFGFLVAVVVYFSYIGAALLSVQAWNFTPDEAYRFVSQQWLNPGAIAAAVVAREVPIWTGAWIARRGRSVTARNATTKADYDRVLADGPQGMRSN